MTHPAPRLPPSPADPDALTARVLDRDRDAFDTLMRQLYAPLCRQAYRLTGSPDVAEDVVTEVFVAFWFKLDTQAGGGPDVLGRTVSIRSYLYRAVRNRALNAIRDARRRHAVAIEEANEIPDTRSGHADVGDDLEAAVERAVSALPDRCRTAFILSREDGMNHAEIAHVMGVSVKAIESAICRALVRLRAALDPYLDRRFR